MDNHPIPQDITGFQFKLIGNMTVKQFIYLAIGTILAWFTFFILPIHVLIRFPLAAIFLGSGISLAFLPIGGRPMDTMISNFIRALLAPTQYIYKKTGGNLSDQIHIQSTADGATPSANSAQSAAPQEPIPPPVQETQAQPELQIAPIFQVPQPLMSLDDENGQEITAEDEKPAEPEMANVVMENDSPLQNQLLETIRQKEALEKELLILKASLGSQQAQNPTPSAAAAAPDADAPPKPTQKAKKVSDAQQNVPQDPNLIIGAIKDPRGNPLPNILVEVKDIEDNPVRAFKTNNLGQFASATSLSNGKYTVTFEDPTGANKFDATQIETTGVPVMPLEIFSVDPREELRRELFN